MCHIPDSELTQYNATAQQGFVRCGLSQDDVGQQDIENCAKWAPNCVKRHSDVLQAQIVESDHADEHNGQRQDLPGRLQVEFDRREVDEPRAQPGQ